MEIFYLGFPFLYVISLKGLNELLIKGWQN